MSNRDANLSNTDFERFRRLVYETAGIKLTPEKKTMLELRIKRRLRALNLNSYARYCEYLFTPGGQKQEIVHFIDVMTTNKTDFFREPSHFQYLVERVLPDLVASHGTARPFLIWSAACSTGEEPYTLAMVVNDFAMAHPGFQFQVLATDISTTVLAKAKTGIYSVEQVRPVSPALQRRYFMRSRDRGSNLMRVVPELRRWVEFHRLNFMDADFGPRAGRMLSFAEMLSSISIALRRSRSCKNSRSISRLRGTSSSATLRPCMI